MNGRDTWHKLTWLIRRSFVLDIKLLFRSPRISFLNKIPIILKKYFLLLKHLVIPFDLGNSMVRFNNKVIYYNSGLASYAGYQADLVEHLYWFDQLNFSKSPIFIDIGANVGYVSTIFADAFRDSIVYAFEPSSKVFTVLEKNTKSYQNIHLFKKGLGAGDSTAQMFVDKKEPAFSSITHKLPGNCEIENIELTTLDEFILAADIKQIDLLKLDVEGFELEVLRGATAALKITKYIHMELNTKDYLLSEVCQILLDAGVKFNLKFIRNFDNECDGPFLDGDVLLELSN